ncbi:MAG: thioesterase family protein [Planctomycetota bacterium]
MDFDHVVRVRARYGETDQMGVIYHASYIPYFEIGRTELMRAHGIRYATMEQSGLFLTVVEVGARYRQPARYDDLLAIRTRLSEFSGVRVRFDYRILRVLEPGTDETLLCEGHTTLACIDRAGKPRRLPEKERTVFARLLSRG